MSGFWNLWVMGLVTANLIFIGWLLYATSTGKKSDQPAGPETTGHTWDGDLKEYNNPLPRWWLGVFYASIVFAIAYLVMFPASELQGSAGLVVGRPVAAAEGGC
jgi:cytochrome c oxidase cbb3-type subunit 3